MKWGGKDGGRKEYRLNCSAVTAAAAVIFRSRKPQARVPALLYPLIFKNGKTLDPLIQENEILEMESERGKEQRWRDGEREREGGFLGTNERWKDGERERRGGVLGANTFFGHEQGFWVIRKSDSPNN